MGRHFAFGIVGGGEEEAEVGLEAQCTARFKGKLSEGKALLETDELIFRGDFRLAIPLTAITSLEVRNGELVVTFPEGMAVFELGPKAQRWAEKVRNPKGLLDKLGVPHGPTPTSQRTVHIAVLNIRDQTFLDQLRQRVPHVVESFDGGPWNMVFLGAESQQELTRLPELRDRIVSNGAIWVVVPKGKQHLREADVLAAGREAGLVDVKVVRFSETHTAHKFVVPVAQREAGNGSQKARSNDL